VAACNVVECIFGAVKCRFSLMVASPEYSEEKQAKFIPALCVLHNFISIYDGVEPDMGQYNPPRTSAACGERPQPAWISEEKEVLASACHDMIAEEMWADYQKYCTEKGIPHAS
jgi:hypothetical protein